jgi:hypothetical protein
MLNWWEIRRILKTQQTYRRAVEQSWASELALGISANMHRAKTVEEKDFETAPRFLVSRKEDINLRAKFAYQYSRHKKFDDL